jgi:hypothetical protein
MHRHVESRFWQGCKRQHETTSQSEAGGEIRLRVTGSGRERGKRKRGASDWTVQQFTYCLKENRVGVDGEISFNFDVLLAGRLSSMCCENTPPS